MRKKATVINSFAGMINQIIFLSTSFIVRFFLAKYLLSDYLGLNGLFANILGILSLVDMGLGTAIAFSLYKPIHEGNTGMVSAIMLLYKKVYIAIGCSIFILSLILLPFMQLIIKDTTLDINYIRGAFVVYSLGTSFSYFFSYNRTLMFASQKNYIVQIVDGIINIIFSILQIIVIVKYNSFLLYIIFKLVSTIIANIIITNYTSKMYKLRNDNTTLSKEYKDNLITQVKALAITNICGTAITSTDNLIISSVIGITDLARNSNYSLIITGIKSLTVSVLSGATASIGDLIVEGDKEKIYYYFEKYYFIHFIVASVCSVCLYFLLDPFIELWVGEEYLFDSFVKIIIIINFYLIITINAVGVFQNLAGFYVLYKKVSVVSAILNIVVSIAFGLKIGILGVFVGTTLSYLYSLIFCNKILHENLFIKSTANYWINQLKYLLLTLFVIMLVTILNIFKIENLILNMVYNITCIGIVYIPVLFIFFRGNDNLRYFIDLILRRKK